MVFLRGERIVSRAAVGLVRSTASLLSLSAAVLSPANCITIESVESDDFMTGSVGLGLGLGLGLRLREGST